MPNNNNNNLLSPVPTQSPPSQAALETNLEAEIYRPTSEEELVPVQNTYWEHHGPWSWVSVCSQPGIRWVCERTQTDDFVEMANGLKKAWSRRLKLKRDQARPRRSPEVDESTAWKYVAGKRRVAILNLI